MGRGGFATKVEKTAVLCILCTKTNPLLLVDSTNMCEYNVPSTGFDPIYDRRTFSCERKSVPVASRIANARCIGCISLRTMHHTIR